MVQNVPATLFSSLTLFVMIYCLKLSLNAFHSTVARLKEYQPEGGHCHRQLLCLSVQWSTEEYAVKMGKVLHTTAVLTTESTTAMYNEIGISGVLTNHYQ